MKLLVLFSLGLLLAVESAPIKPVDSVEEDLELLSATQDSVEMDKAVQKMLENEKILAQKSYPKARQKENEAFKKLAGVLTGVVKEQFEEKLKDPKKWNDNTRQYIAQPRKPWETRIVNGSGDDGSGTYGSGSGAF